MHTHAHKSTYICVQLIASTLANMPHAKYGETHSLLEDSNFHAANAQCVKFVENYKKKSISDFNDFAKRINWDNSIRYI